VRIKRIKRIKRTEITRRRRTWQNRATTRAEARARMMEKDYGTYPNRRRRDQVIRTAFRALIACVE
jgi:hypothetical protein